MNSHIQRLTRFSLASALLFLSTAPASATDATITISVSNPFTFADPPVMGSLANYSGGACYVSQACVGYVPPSTVQPSSMGSNMDGSFGSASAGGPTNGSDPTIVTSNGMIDAPVNSTGYETSAYGFSVVPSAPVTSYQLFPATTIDFSPQGQNGSALVVAFQRTEAQFTNTANNIFADLLLYVRLDGPANASFVLDTTANTMTLTVPSGDSGSITVSSTYWDNPTATEASLIDFAWWNGVVTRSSNSLGLSLPTIGASASFSVSVAAFTATLPAISPGDAPAVKIFNVVGQSAELR